MTQRLQKFTLTAHVIFSVGWLGAVVAYLALAVSGLLSHDDQLVRAAYLSMELIGWSVIVPLSLATVLSGLLQSLRGPWGLLRHYWVLAKFLLTAAATLILLQHMQAVSFMASVAASTDLSTTEFDGQRLQLVVHAGGGLLVLIVVTVLSVYKPWGLTPYGKRKRGEQAVVLPSVAPARSTATTIRNERRKVRGTPRWTVIVAAHALGLVLMALVLHLAGGGFQLH